MVKRATALSKASPDTPASVKASWLGHELGQFLGTEEGLVVVALDFDLVAGQGLGEGGALLMVHVHVVGLQCFLDLGADAPHRLRLLIGSCGTRPILVPRSLSNSLCLAPAISSPSSLMEPLTT